VPLSPSDIAVIQQLYAAYNYAADSGDGKAFAECFTSDGILDIDGMTHLEGSKALSELFQGQPQGGRRTRHVAVNILVDGEGDLATGRAYLLMVGTSTSPATITITGQYEDRLVRTAEGWRFQERRCTFDKAAE